MTKILSKQSSNIPLAKEENLINWSNVLEMLRKTFGNDTIVYNETHFSVTLHIF